MNFTEFCDDLNESPWMGAVCEVGIGLPFQSMFVEHPGASKTILFTHSPYSKAFQPNDVPRSVGHEMAARYSWDNYWKCKENNQVQSDYLFSLAVSASHKMTGERGLSHGWVSVVVGERGDREPKAYSFHWRNQKDLNRKEAGEVLAHHIGWFLHKILFNKWDNWSDAIKASFDMKLRKIRISTRGMFSIDVIRAPDITMEEHLLLAERAPLLFHHNEFKRPVDYLRQYNRTYRGSFNPITLSHEEIGQGALFEVSLDNARKGKVSFEDLAHRIRMIDLAGRPTLITSHTPLFVDLHKSLIRLGSKSMTYLVGADTFNAIVDEKYINEHPAYPFFEDFERDNQMQSGSFIVISRDGHEVTENKYSEKIHYSVINSGYPHISSSAVREGKLEYVSDKVRSYIEKHKLYSE